MTQESCLLSAMAIRGNWSGRSSGLADVVGLERGNMPDGSEQPVAKLAAKVAHELNNPLDAVLRFVSLAQRKAQMGEIADLQRHLADAQFGLQRMAEILRDLMQMG